MEIKIDLTKLFRSTLLLIAFLSLWGIYTLVKKSLLSYLKPAKTELLSFDNHPNIEQIDNSVYPKLERVLDLEDLDFIELEKVCKDDFSFYQEQVILMVYYSLIGEHKKEFERAEKRMESIPDDPNPLLNYINSYYLDDIKNQLINGELYEARRNAGIAYTLYNLTDLSPAESRPTIATKVILYNCLFNDPRLVLNSKDLIRLINIFDDLDYKNLNSFKATYEEEKMYEDFVAYISGVIFFQDQQYEEAIKKMNHVIRISKNIPLKEVAALMIGRSIFWQYHENKNKTKNQKSRVESELNKILPKLKKDSFKEDILTYISEIQYNWRAER